MALNFANNNSLSSITSLPANISGGTLNLISTQTASNSATIDFTSGIDSTYKEYQVHFINVHPSNNAVMFAFQGDTGTNTNYNQTMTTTHFRAYHAEADDGAGVGYKTDKDQAQGTSFQAICEPINNNNDDSCSGYLHLFNPSSTTFVKHFISRFSAEYATDTYVAGYFNTTSAIDEIQFKMSSGDIDAGDICLYGIS